MQATSHADTLIARRSRVLGPAYRHFYEEPLTPVRGQDVWLVDEAGKRYLDCYNNVPSVGHCHPHVLQALQQQAAQLNTHTRYLHEAVVSYAEKLVSLFPKALDTVMFTCTGSEANDLALRVAQAVTGRTGLIVTRNAYHGVTMALADISPSLRPVTAAHVRTIPAPRTPRGWTPADVARQFARDIEVAVASLRHDGFEPAALMVDTVFASDGIFIDDNGVLQAGADAIRKAGGLFIADEVQGGFGRTGGHWWAFERDAGLVPDMVTLGKPMGAGHPMGGLVLQAPLAEVFGRSQRYFNTFGGNTVSVAVGRAVLEVIDRENLRTEAMVVGAHLRSGLEALATRHASIGDVRGSGLYVAVELVDPGHPDHAPDAALSQFLVNEMRREGVLISSCGEHANILKIRPPLTFKRAHAEIFLRALETALPRFHPAG